MRLVEGLVELEAVRGQVLAQRVGRPPGHVFADKGGGDAHRLAAHGDAQKEQARVDQGARLASRQGRVDEKAHDLGDDQPQANVREEQDGQQQCMRPLRPEVGAQQGPILLDWDLDLELLLGLF